MNRFDYLSGARQAPFNRRPSGLTIDNRLRLPLAAFVAAITLATMLGIVQLARLHAAHPLRHKIEQLELNGGEREPLAAQQRLATLPIQD